MESENFKVARWIIREDLHLTELRGNAADERGNDFDELWHQLRAKIFISLVPDLGLYDLVYLVCFGWVGYSKAWNLEQSRMVGISMNTQR